MPGPTSYQTVWIKAQSVWGTAAAPAAADALDVAVVPFPLQQEALTPDVGYAGAHSIEPTPGSKAGISLQINGVLHGWSATTPTADPVATPEQLLLEWVFGGVIRDGYATDLAGGASGSVNVTAGVANHVGQSVLLPLDATASRGIAWYQSLAANVYTLIADLIDAPASSGTIYGSATFYLDPIAIPLPFTIRVRGSVADADKVYSDCHVSGTVTLALSSRGQWSYQIPVVALAVDEAPGDAAIATPAAALYPRVPATLGASGSRMTIANGAVCFQEATLTINVPTEMQNCHNANQGVKQVIVMRRTAQLELTGIDRSQDALAAPGASVGVVQIDGNTTPGRAASLLIPLAHAAEKETPADISGILGSRLLLKPSLYAGDSGASAVNNTPLKFALL